MTEHDHGNHDMRIVLNTEPDEEKLYCDECGQPQRMIMRFGDLPMVEGRWQDLCYSCLSVATQTLFAMHFDEKVQGLAGDGRSSYTETGPTIGSIEMMEMRFNEALAHRDAQERANMNRDD